MKADGYGRGSIDREVTIRVQANTVNTILRDVSDVDAERKIFAWHDVWYPHDVLDWICTDFFAIADDDISYGGLAPTPRIEGWDQLVGGVVATQLFRKH